MILLKHSQITTTPLPFSIHVPLEEAYRKKYYQLDQALTYTHQDHVLVVPRGYLTDGASIPRWLWTFVGSPFQPEYIRASLLHDFLYEHRLGTRKEADAIFYAILLEDDVPPATAFALWAGLRGFAWYHWNKDNEPK